MAGDETNGPPLSTDDIAELLSDEPIEPSGRVLAWRRSTASGSILGAIALGLREVFETKREKAPIEVEAPGEPPGPKRVSLELDPDDPAASTVTFRPWVDHGRHHHT